MPKYLVEYTAWLEVTAKDEDTAYNKAMYQLEQTNPVGSISLGDIEDAE